jgi:hypothetical protein
MGNKFKDGFDSTHVQVRTLEKIPSTRQRSWHKKDKGEPPPDWARNAFYVMSIAQNWYGKEWNVPGTKAGRRFCYLLEALREHFHNGKREEMELPADDSDRKAWAKRRAKLRVEWQRLRKYDAAYKRRVAQLEKDMGTRHEFMTPEDKRDFFLNAFLSHEVASAVRLDLAQLPKTPRELTLEELEQYSTLRSFHVIPRGAML